MDLSNEAEARSLVSGEKSTSLTSALWPVILARGFLSSAGFHKNKVKSSEPDTKRSGAEPCSTRKVWGYPHRGHKDLNSPVLTTNSTYPNFIISLQSFLLQFFHWGKTKRFLHDNILMQTSKPESKCSHWNSTTMKHLQDPYTIQWGPGGWRWQLQVQKLQCAGRSLCWEPGCSPSGRDPAESCTGHPIPTNTNIHSLIPLALTYRCLLPLIQLILTVEINIIFTNITATHTYIFGSPDFDRSVLGGSVEKSISSPLHTGDWLSVSRQDLLTTSQHRIPNTYWAVLWATGQVPTLWVTDREGVRETVNSGQMIKNIYIYFWGLGCSLRAAIKRIYLINK